MWRLELNDDRLHKIQQGYNRGGLKMESFTGVDSPRSGTIIEGVGDEIVHSVFGVFIVIAIPLTIAFLNR